MHWKDYSLYFGLNHRGVLEHTIWMSFGRNWNKYSSYAPNTNGHSIHQDRLSLSEKILLKFIMWRHQTHNIDQMTLKSHFCWHVLHLNVNIAEVQWISQLLLLWIINFTDIILLFCATARFYHVVNSWMKLSTTTFKA